MLRSALLGEERNSGDLFRCIACAVSELEPLTVTSVSFIAYEQCRFLLIFMARAMLTVDSIWSKYGMEGTFAAYAVEQN
jgi:hypothetical protein